MKVVNARFRVHHGNDEDDLVHHVTEFGDIRALDGTVKYRIGRVTVACMPVMLSKSDFLETKHPINCIICLAEGS